MGKVSKIIDYLEHPKVVGEIKGLNANKVDFDPYTLGDMVNDLTDNMLYKLLEKVGVVCEQWKALRLAPNNDIGTIARYQECMQWIEKRLDSGLVKPNPQEYK